MSSALLGNGSPETGSFRDPDSRVFYVDGKVRRALSAEGLADWDAVSKSKAFQGAVADGRVVATELVERRESSGDGWAAVLEHERIPFVSYPYEWPFGMLRDAALLQLDLLAACLEEGLILKDATPYNIQFRGSRPVFIDVGSFTKLGEGEPWVGYRQFCTLFLYPLMLQAYRGVPFQPWLRGSLEGISPAEMAGLLSRRDRLRRGVMGHVVLHSRLERSHGDRGGDARKEVRSAGFNVELIKANVRKLRKRVEKLRAPDESTAWTEYAAIKTYTDAETEAKDAFVRAASEQVRPRLAWDLGCNDGRYARIVAEQAEQVVALDSDQATVDVVYRDLKEAADERVLVLTSDLTDPSPARGWRGRERATLIERGRPDLVLALALIHHISITRSVPLEELVDWLAEIGAPLVIEFVAPEDSMAKRLIAAKNGEIHPDYDRDGFERILGERFEVLQSEALTSGTRFLYLARPRPAAAGC